MSAGINELSKDTLKNYIKKAADDLESSRDLKGGKMRRAKGLQKAATKVNEKWDSNYETPKSKRGMFKGRSLSSLEAEDKHVSGKKKHQVDFAIRAKTGWGKVKEGEEVVTESRDWDEMSPEARDLVLHADNDSRLYNSSHKPIVANLANKMKRGVYDKDKAKKLWGYHADRAAMSLAKEGGDGNTPWHKMFNTTHRKEAASHWEEVHRDDLEHEHKRHHNMHENFDPSFDVDDTNQILAMVQSALENKPVTFAEHFANAIQPKLTDTIEALKDELKSFVFNHLSGKSMFEEGVNCRSKMLLSSKAKRKKPAVDTADFSPVGAFGTEI